MNAIIPRKDWTRHPRGGAAVRPSERLDFTIHYDGASRVNHTGTALATRVLNWHVNGRKWADVGYSFLIDQDGRIYEGRGWNNRGAHTLGKLNGVTGNIRAIGVYVGIGGNQEPSAAALDALRWLYQEATRVFGRRLTVRGHRDYQSTACPGRHLYRLIQAGTIAADATPAPPSTGVITPPPTPGKSVAQMATEVIDGKHGNGHENRRRSLGIDAATYQKVRAEVNRRVYGSSATTTPGKSVAQMATEVIAGKHGNGHENRRRSLGISEALYQKVRAEVNRRVYG